jgi:hypothetical protein
MAGRYYRVEDDVDVKGRWFLNGLRDGDGTRLDARDFRYGVPVDVGPPLKVSLWNDHNTVNARDPLTVSLRRAGAPLDFTFADFDMPVVALKVARIMGALAVRDIQRIPVGVESRDERFEIINVISRLSCIDAAASEVMWWTEADRRPDKLGKPRMITQLKIDPTRVEGQHIFRPEGWEVALVVSDLVKGALEEVGVTGITFSEV